MKLQVSGQLHGTVTAPISKSYLHRLLIAAALCFEETTVIHGYTMSQDIAATAQVLQACGATIQFHEEENTITVVGLPRCRQTCTIFGDCNESGSTLRFLVPVLAALGQRAHLCGHGRLPQRPITPLSSQLAQHGVQISPETLPFTLSGQLQPGIYSFSGDVSSQYITGLLLALPLLPTESTVLVTTPLQSRGYVDLTLQVLRRFGITIHQQNNVFIIPGGQHYSSPGKTPAEGDWSNAAFWLTAGAMGSPLSIYGLSPASLQGDRKISTILARMGADVTWHENAICAFSCGLHATEIDAAQIPDIIPILAVAAATAQGTTHIINAGRLRMKESDRLSAMADCLCRIGALVEEGADYLTIKGQPFLQGGTVSSYGDHRIAMAMAIASLRCREPIYIENPSCVAKSYPNFFEEWEQLGGDLHVIHMG